MRRVATGTLLAAVMAAATMLGAAPAGAVANGRDAAQGQFPFSVRLQMTNIKKADGTVYDSACSAALISPQWIVTAGHCFHDGNRNRTSGAPRYKTTAMAGVVNIRNQEAKIVDVVDVRQSPVNDIALAKLAKPVSGLTTLGIDTEPPVNGEELTIAGWGATTSVNPAPSEQLRYGKVAVSDVTDTTVLVHGVWPQADTGACAYDSGAPYFADGKLVSVESTGPDCPHASNETTGRIDVIADWVKRAVAS